MKQRWTVPVLAAAVGVALTLSACGGNTPASSGGKEKNELTVWLMNGSVPDAIVKEVNADLAKQHPGAKVTVQVQEWNGIQDKLTTALASNNPPDVIEMGNTQNAKFSASGALLDLTKSKAKLGADQWPAGLASAGQWNGKTYGAPLLAANRVVIYRTDLFQAGRRRACRRPSTSGWPRPRSSTRSTPRPRTSRASTCPGRAGTSTPACSGMPVATSPPRTATPGRAPSTRPAAAQAMGQYAQLQALSKAPEGR